jgi:hypothetical protein
VSIIGQLCFFSSFYNVGYKKLTTIYNRRIENTLNSTNLKCGFDIFLLSYLLFIITNLCCIILTYVYVDF